MLYSTIRISALLLVITTMMTSSNELPPAPAAAPVVLADKSWLLDDALFHGCFHNAFEGTPIALEAGKWKAGPQTIQRTKGVLTGQGSDHATMTLIFRLDAAPASGSTLRVTGLNDRHQQVHAVEVALNGTKLGEAITFPRNRAPEMGLNQRYYVGWEQREIAVPAGVLQAGENRLTITNLTDAFAAATWPFVLIDTVEWEFAEALSATVSPPPAPLFYYGLSEGVETQLWPVVATDNRITLLAGIPLEYNFFATLPREKGAGEILLHVWTKSPVSLFDLAGNQLASREVEGGSLHVVPIARLIHYETPHSAQGVRLFMQADAGFEDGQLRAWYTADGVAFRTSDYPLRGITLEPVAGREALDFHLSLWGGNVPEGDAARRSYIDMLRGAGFDHVFTGDDGAVNRELKESGFDVVPRFGWFGHGFSVTDATRQWAAVNQHGELLERDFCPLAILEQADHPELGKYFARTRDFAALEGIDGLCVDYECAPVWCWCDNCLSLFHAESGEAVSRSDVAPDGRLAGAYREFGRRRNRDLLTRVKEEMLGVNPELKYLALASAADLPAYWYDPRGARHSIRELATFADAIYASHYCYEVPGGMKSVLPTLATVQRFAVQSGRAVDACLITPVAQTVNEFPRYRQASLRPDMTRLITLLTALGGGKGISFFRGDCFDGAQFAAIRQAVTELIQLQPYLASGLDRSLELSVEPAGEVKLHVATELAQNLLSRFVWRPQVQYYHDHVQLLRSDDGRDRLVALFNYSASPMALRLRFTGLLDEAYGWENALTGETLGETTRHALEGAGVEFEVPSRSCRLLRLKTND